MEIWSGFIPDGLLTIVPVSSGIENLKIMGYWSFFILLMFAGMIVQFMLKSRFEKYSKVSFLTLVHWHYQNYTWNYSYLHFQDKSEPVVQLPGWPHCWFCPNYAVCNIEMRWLSFQEVPCTGLPQIFL